MPTDEPAARTSLDSRWWWSAALWIVVGLGVIGYQSTAITAGDAIVLNWVMVAVGAAVAVVGLSSLKKAYDAHTAAESEAAHSPGATPAETPRDDDA